MLLAFGMICSSVPTQTKASRQYIDVIEIEENNTEVQAQFIDIKPSYTWEDEKVYRFSGGFSSLNDEDWIKIRIPPERGSLNIATDGFYPLENRYVEQNGKLVDTTHYGPGDIVFIRLRPVDSSDLSRNYKYKISFHANPAEGNPHEPNDIFDLTNNIYEFATIENNQLIDTNWTSPFDYQDNFAIEATNRGTVGFEVHYPDDEFDFWTTSKREAYIPYVLYAEKKDGTYTRIFSEVVIGMPNQVFRASVPVSNPEFTGRYVLTLRNVQIINFNYKVKMTFVAKPPQKRVRIAGKDRYSTAREFARQFSDKSLDTVILASGENFPDALAGGVLNKVFNGTILLVNNNNIQDNLKEVKRILKSNGKVIILGGSQAVSNKVENEFKKHFKVERIAGNDRIATSIEIAKKANPNAKSVFLVYGYNFSDALTIVPYAAKTNTPIILSKSESLDDKVKAYLKQGVTSVKIIGGNKVISKNIENELRSMGIQVERISGSGRIQTALMIANKYFPNSTGVALTNAYKFPDVLAGSRFAVDKDMPILLTGPNSLDRDVKKFIIHKDYIYIYGGEKSVSPDILRQ
jgi:putative cell wall-binding protein